MDQQRIPQPGGTPIVYFRSHQHGAIAPVQHFAERPTQFLGEERPIRFNKSQVSDIMDKAGCVSVEKHNANFCL